MSNKRAATHIARALDELLEQSHLKTRAREQLCALVWKDAVGEAVASVSWVRRVKDGVGYVQCESPAWAQSLSLEQRGILQKLANLLGGPYITKLRFSTTGPQQEARQELVVKPAPQPAADELAAVQLTDAEVERIRQVAAEAPAGELRERLEAALIAREKDRRWKLAHGYQECRVCGNPFHGLGAACYACQWEGRSSAGREGGTGNG